MNRAERRRRAAEEAKRFAGGFDVTDPHADQVAALMRVLHEHVKTSVGRQSVSPLMYFILSNFDAATRRFAEVKVDCGRGCSHCCNMWVDASPAEIIYIAKTLTGDDRAQAERKVATALGRTRGMSYDDRYTLDFPCPMLEGGACSIYANRPLACRAAASADAEVCARYYHLLTKEEIPVPAPFLFTGSAYRIALSGALKHAGLSYRAVEFNSGLELALSDRTAERRWLAGEDVFAGTQAPPISDIFTTPHLRAAYEEAFK